MLPSLSSPLPTSSVLVVDDEPSLRRVLRTSLSASGFSVEEARNGEEAVGAVQQHRFDLVVLDINMPGMGGVEACQRIRESSPRVGIVMLTVRDLEEDKVRALEAGADDYVSKPFRLRELVARLRAVLRRTQVQIAEEAKPELIQAGDLVVDLRRRLLWRRGKPVHLSPKEFEVLAFMIQNQGAPLTHAKLLRSIWGPEYGNEQEYLRSYVRMLRKKIEDDPAKPQYIVTEPWVGYRFRNPTDPASPSVPDQVEE